MKSEVAGRCVCREAAGPVPAPPAAETAHPKVVCLDLDGTLTKRVASLDLLGELLPGARQAVEALRRLGYRIIVHTARPSSQADRIREHLDGEGVPVDGVNADPRAVWETSKPLADLYIDDRALRFRGDWAATLREAEALLGHRPGDAAGLSYDELLAKVAGRAAEVRRFEAFLRTDTAWAEAPASSRFHLARPGGLVEHSLNVARTLLRLRQALAPELPEESCVLAALYHDAGKAGSPGRPYYLPNPDAWQVRNRGIRYVTNRELPWLDIASRSLLLVSRFVPLTDEEAQAIRFHDGQYIEENRSVAHREAPLTRLLQYADNWSGGVLEAERPPAPGAAGGACRGVAGESTARPVPVPRRGSEASVKEEVSNEQ